MRVICWLDNPNILLAVVLLQFLVVLVELAKFVGENVGIRYEVEVLLAEPLLHPDNIEAKAILPRDLVTLREVIDFLVLIEALVQVAFAT